MKAIKSIFIIILGTCLMQTLVFANDNFKKAKPIDGRKLMIPSFTERLNASDDQVNSMKDQVNSWNRANEKEENWGPKSVYLKDKNRPTESKKQSFVMGGVARIAEKRLLEKDEDLVASEENMEEESKGKAKVAASSGEAKALDINYRTRPSSGRASVEMKTPVLSTSLNLNAFKSHADIHTYKKFKEVGLQTGTRYELKNKRYETYIDKNLTTGVIGRVSSTHQSYGDTLQKTSDRKVEVIFSTSF